MRTAVLHAAALLALSGCGGRVYGSQASGPTSDAEPAAPGDAGSDVPGDAGSDGGLAAKPCRFQGFAPAVSYTPAAAPITLTAIDTTRAGTFDLAVSEFANSASGSTCELFANPGNGVFASQPFDASGNFCGNLVAADLDGDGKIDVASQWNPYSRNNAHTGVLNVDFGIGRHQFAPTLAEYPMPRANSDLVTGDFDGDGRPDIAAVGFDYGEQGGGLPVPRPVDFTLAVLLNAGAGQLGAPALYPSPHALSSVATGDFDGDGRLDIAALGDTGMGGFDVYFNAGGGTFQAPRSFVISETGAANGLGVADFDGDGRADVASTSVLGDNLVLQIFNGRSDASFTGAASYAIPYVPALRQILIGEFNGDGKPDIAMVINSDAQGVRLDPVPVAVFVNQGDGTFAPPTSYLVGDATKVTVTGVAAGDFNGDTVTDVAVSTESQESPFGVRIHVLLSECQ